MMQNNNFDNAMQSMTLALNIERSEAIKRNRSVFICGGSDVATGMQCVTGRDWGNYIIVYYDHDGTPIASAKPEANCANPPTDDCALHIIKDNEIAEGITVVSDQDDFIQIQSDGTARVQSALAVCDSNNRRRRIWISDTGRFDIRGATVAQCTPPPPSP